MSEESRRIGHRMRELRLALHDSPSQAEMAAQLPGHVQGAEWSRWETGRHRPHSDTLEAIAKVLDTTVADLIRGPMAERDEPRPSGSPLDALSPPLSADLDRRLEWIESALQALLVDRDLPLDAPPSQPAPRPRTGSSPGGSGNG